VESFDRRFDAIDRRFDGLDRRIDVLDAKLDRFRDELTADLGGRLAALDHKISRHFTWTVGIQVAVLLAVVAALA
jgi:hypothetical protein